MMSSSLYFSKRLVGQNVVEVIQPETRNQKPSDYYQKNLHHFSLIGRNPSNCHCPISFLQLPSEKAIRQSRQTTGESTPGRPMPTHQTEKKKKKNSQQENFPTFSQRINQSDPSPSAHPEQEEEEGEEDSPTGQMDQRMDGRMEGFSSGEAVRPNLPYI